ncbi:MAG: transporter [Alphaproteobacteria bacterium]|nr:transporter [Alphaproteobacteria bacterium]
MSRLTGAIFFLAIGFAGLLTLPRSSFAGTAEEIQELREGLKRQEYVIKEQQQKLAVQEAALASQQKKLDRLDQLSPADMEKARGTGPADPKTDAVPGAAAYGPSQPASLAPGTPIESPRPKEPELRPDVIVLPDQGGVLTPKGVMMYENSLEYTNTTSNVFTFNGVQVAELILVGVVNTSSARRQILQDSSRVRFGFTDRLEADVRVPFVYRNDATSQTDTSSSPPATTRTSYDGYGLGDVDMGLSYQLNRGLGGWPFFAGNFRYKTATGDGPYDVPYDSNNVATSLPTGTGFNSVEGSMTVIKVSDPVVLFANAGYVYSIGENVNKDINTTRILEVNPGGVVNGSTGMGFSINQETSFTLGYKQSYVFPTYQSSQNLNTGAISKSRSDTLAVGSLLTGISYSLSRIASLNFTAEIGVTGDAPDVHLGLRVPIRLGKFY